jgi:hypothetical protein
MLIGIDWIEIAPSCWASRPLDRPPTPLERLNVAMWRQSTWQVRVKQDGKGSRGIWIVPLMIRSMGKSNRGVRGGASSGAME